MQKQQEQQREVDAVKEELKRIVADRDAYAVALRAARHQVSSYASFGREDQGSVLTMLERASQHMSTTAHDGSSQNAAFGQVQEQLVMLQKTLAQDHRNEVQRLQASLEDARREAHRARNDVEVG